MSDFAATYALTRGRFQDAVLGLTEAQLNFRLLPETLTLGEAAIHVAGVEVWFAAQLRGEALTGELGRLAQAAVDGVIDGDFPFSREEIVPAKVEWALSEGRKAVEALLADDSPELRSKQIKSALGPMIDGTGALVRLAFHPGYHSGQAHFIKSSPDYPS